MEKRKKKERKIPSARTIIKRGQCEVREKWVKKKNSKP